ncbi:hypothetical protein D9758_013425 [Tetrapyrgos nigripes]|uniref:Uncharacterized protein n=1 Tax=Tetrapyrgos nigripes TaxID=182062 RepID=A0A8H5CK35_9AGAR|nr:hypothetical protein D9758_013425 [Tetrapyrgos nigripes]
MVGDQNAELITLLHLAMTHRSGECAVNDFAVQLFRTMGYVHRERVARTRKDLALQICGELRHAKTDVCIVDRNINDIILLVQEDRRVEDGENPIAEAQLVALAIAAFADSEKNRNREARGLEPLLKRSFHSFISHCLDLAFTLWIMPGITMIGTSPTFYKIPVTPALVDNVCFGTYPQEATIVTYCSPPLGRRYSEGMKPLDNRKAILSCYEAFKSVVGNQ